MGEEGRRETGDKRMGMQTVHCRRREKKRENGEGGRTEKGDKKRRMKVGEGGRRENQRERKRIEKIE